MRNLKKFLALVLAMMMVFSLMVTVNAANTGRGSKYAANSTTLYKYGIVSGVDSTGNLALDTTPLYHYNYIARPPWDQNPAIVIMVRRLGKNGRFAYFQATFGYVTVVLHLGSAH